MSETVTVTPHKYDRLGVIHVGVLQDYTAVVAGDVHKLEDGESWTFERTGVTVTRKGDEFEFSKG